MHVILNDGDEGGFKPFSITLKVESLEEAEQLYAITQSTLISDTFTVIPLGNIGAAICKSGVNVIRGYGKHVDRLTKTAKERSKFW